MPRRYDPRYAERPSRYADDPRERQEKDKTPTWQKILKWGAISILALIIILFILSATGNLKGSKTSTPGLNQTTPPTQMEQLTTYIISQQNKGLDKEAIVQRLQLAGFKQEDINTGFALSDPVIQQILALEKEGKTRQEIVETLLNQGIDPLDIQARYDIIEKSRTSNLFAEGSWLRKNWFLLIPLAILGYFLWKNHEDNEEEKLLPKVYTLDECEEYAREYLEKKGKNFNPSKQYRNRPDIRQYRFVYEEPLYPGFNDHLPTGQRIGQRTYWLIAIGYDREVIDYQETKNDNEIRPFLYGPPKGFEQSGSKEYMGLRARSEQPIEEGKKRTIFDDEREEGYYRPYPYRRRTYQRFRPGPVRGFEE